MAIRPLGGGSGGGGGGGITSETDPVASADLATHAALTTGAHGLTALLAAKSQALTATAVKTSAYTAAAGDFVPVDTTSGAVTITLPSGSGRRVKGRREDGHAGLARTR
jgi:hypothetical protein